MSDERQPRLPFDQPRRRKPKPPEYTPPPPCPPSRWERARKVASDAWGWIWAGTCWFFRHLGTIKTVAAIILLLVLAALGYAAVHVRIGDDWYKFERGKAKPPAPPPKGWEPKVEKAK